MRKNNIFIPLKDKRKQLKLNIAKQSPKTKKAEYRLSVFSHTITLAEIEQKAHIFAMNEHITKSLNYDVIYAETFDRLFSLYRPKKATVTRNNTVKAYSVSTKKADTVKVKSIAEISAELFRIVKEYPKNTDFEPCNPLNTVFYENINIAITKSFLNSLCGKNSAKNADKKPIFNDTAFNILCGRNLPFNYDDLLQIVNLTICENADLISINENGDIDVSALIVPCFKECSNNMYRQAVRNSKHTSYEQIIDDCMQSIEMQADNKITVKRTIGNHSDLAHELTIDNSDYINLNYDIKVIKRTINSTYKADTANDIITTLNYRLKGLKLSEISKLSGLSIDRLKYCNRQLKKVGKGLLFFENDVKTEYKPQPTPTHTIKLNNKVYTVTTINQPKKPKRNKTA